MTEEQRKLCRDLIIHRGGQGNITREDFLQRFPSAVEDGKLALKWLEEAYRAQSKEDLLCTLVVGFNFDFGPEHLDILRHLVDLDWHYSHEDVVSALDHLRTPDAVDALFRATQWIPKSLEYDDTRALAVKAIWALGKIPGTEAEAKLEMLARSEDAILRQSAVDQLELRHTGGIARLDQTIQ
jgi:hypothetical protein